MPTHTHTGQLTNIETKRNSDPKLINVKLLKCNFARFVLIYWTASVRQCAMGHVSAWAPLNVTVIKIRSRCNNVRLGAHNLFTSPKWYEQDTPIACLNISNAEAKSDSLRVSHCYCFVVKFQNRCELHSSHSRTFEIIIYIYDLLYRGQTCSSLCGPNGEEVAYSAVTKPFKVHNGLASSSVNRAVTMPSNLIVSNISKVQLN